MPKRGFFPMLLLLAAAVATLALPGCSGAPSARAERTVQLSMRGYTFNGSNPTLQFEPGERIHFIVTNDESTCNLFDTTLTGTPSPLSMSDSAMRIIHCGPLMPSVLAQK